MASGEEDPWEIGRARASRETGGFSYRNAFIIEADGKAAGALIGYEIPDQIDPIPADTPAIFRPLQELENLAPGSWYVNVLAVTPEMRNRGLGARLLTLADELGRAVKKRVASVIVSDANRGAHRLYQRSGYSEVAKRPIEKENWVHDGKNWVLLTKAI